MMLSLGDTYLFNALISPRISLAYFVAPLFPLSLTPHLPTSLPLALKKNTRKPTNHPPISPSVPAGDTPCS